MPIDGRFVVDCVILLMTLPKVAKTLSELTCIEETELASKVDVEQAYFAVVGENLMKFARQSNYAGIIVNGYVRDTAQISDIPVALYAIGTCPRKYIPTTGGERNISVSFGGVDFNNGDYLYADTDGVIVTAERIV